MSKGCTNDKMGFPILRNGSTTYPAVPWKLVEPHRDQAMENHRQTLERLAARGGLSHSELYYVLNDKPWPSGLRPDEQVYIDWLQLYLEVHDHFDHDDDCK